MIELDVNFAEHRAELRLTQQDVAVLLGVTRVTYIKYEAEPETMPLGKYVALMEHFERLRELKGAA